MSKSNFKQIFPGGRPKPGRRVDPTHAHLMLAAQAAVDTLKATRETDLANIPRQLEEGLKLMEKLQSTLLQAEIENVPTEEDQDVTVQAGYLASARVDLSFAQNKIRHGLAALIHHGQLGVINDLVMDVVT